jgi:hypothetical protein
MVNAELPSHPYIGKIPYINFNEGILELMWDKKRGETKYDEMNDGLWLGSYIIKNKLEKGKYYFSDMDVKNMALPIGGSLIQPYIKGT